MLKQPCMVDSSHPIDIYTGINLEGYESLLIVSDEKPFSFKSGKYLKVEINRRNDKKWVTLICSTFPQNIDIFSKLCIDLIECSRNTDSEKNGLSIISKRYSSWFQLFRNSYDLLDDSVLKGLIGELAFAKRLIHHGYSAEDVLNSWEGPNGSDRDFTLYDNWYEIKSISTGKNYVTISSLNQLDSSQKGFLILFKIDSSSKSDNNAKSVNNYISEFNELLSDRNDLLELFETKLEQIGYKKLKEYDDIYFLTSDLNVYEVNEHFPRLTSSNVDPAIVGAKYDLSIAAIEQWKRGEDELWN